MPEGEARDGLADLAVEGLDRYLASVPDDGGIDEGYMCWWQGACRALETLDVLHFATSSVLGGIASGTLREVVAFPHRMHMGDDWSLNFADGSARPPSDCNLWDALHRAAR
jgi:hypothetical protein